MGVGGLDGSGAGDVAVGFRLLADARLWVRGPCQILNRDSQGAGKSCQFAARGEGSPVFPLDDGTMGCPDHAGEGCLFQALGSPEVRNPPPQFLELSKPLFLHSTGILARLMWNFLEKVPGIVS